MMYARDTSGAVYPQSGVREGFHVASHHSNVRANMDQFALINRYHTSLLAYFLEKLQFDPGRRRHAAGSLAGSLWQQHEQRQPARSRSSARGAWPVARPVRCGATGNRDARRTRRCRICCWRSWTSWESSRVRSATARGNWRSDDDSKPANGAGGKRWPRQLTGCMWASLRVRADRAGLCRCRRLDWSISA